MTSAAFGESLGGCMSEETRVLQAKGKGQAGIDDIVNKAVTLAEQSKRDDVL